MTDTKKIQGAIQIDTERCKGCGLCVGACPRGIVSLSPTVNRMGYHFAVQTDWESCNGCSCCGITCPDACITVYRKAIGQEP